MKNKKIIMWITSIVLSIGIILGVILVTTKPDTKPPFIPGTQNPIEEDNKISMTLTSEEVRMSSYSEFEWDRYISFGSMYKKETYRFYGLSLSELRALRDRMDERDYEVVVVVVVFNDDIMDHADWYFENYPGDPYTRFILEDSKTHIHSIEFI